MVPPLPAGGVKKFSGKPPKRFRRPRKALLPTVTVSTEAVSTASPEQSFVWRVAPGSPLFLYGARIPEAIRLPRHRRRAPFAPLAASLSLFPAGIFSSGLFCAEKGILCGKRKRASRKKARRAVSQRKHNSGTPQRNAQRKRDSKNAAVKARRRECRNGNAAKETRRRRTP